ncbi:hypothetical protein QUF63_16250 [Anaerolineales bacterium HSG25]|nr:hypothetical protein [Anaerolineales bacterium HSG25]
MSKQTITLQLSLSDHSHPDEVDQATSQLYQQLRHSEADHVEKQRGFRSAKASCFCQLG